MNMETILFLAVAAIVMLLVKSWHQSKVIEKLVLWQDSQVQCNKVVAKAVAMVATEVDKHTIAFAAVGDYIAMKEGVIRGNETSSKLP